MKRTIPFELFEQNQYIYFDIMRLAELEKINGVPMSHFLQAKDLGVNFCLAGLTVGLQHHTHKATPLDYAEKIDKHLESGGTLTDISDPIIRAILVTGIFGKELANKAMEKPTKPEEKQPSEATQVKNE